MKIVFQPENSNEYMTRMFVGPLRSFIADQGFSTDVQPIDEQKDSLVVVHGDLLSPERIRRIKEAGNVLVVIDINDSSYLSSAYIHSPEQQLCDLIFKVSGVPKQNEVNEMNLDRNFRVKISREKYLPDDQWNNFLSIRPRIKPLPYVLWNPIVPAGEAVIPHSQRNGKVLIRGGNHFWRVVLSFRLMQEGLLDDRSEFHTAAYFSPTMEKRFQYCDECKAERSQHGRTLYDSPIRPKTCNSRVIGWGLDGEFYGGPMFGKHEFGNWNNVCPHSFFWLVKQFETHRGPLDKTFLERLFNGDMRHALDFKNDLGRASYAGDSKWLNTINLPPRFWEAASVGTPSLYTARTADQDYWPAVTEGEHYLSYSEDMEQFLLDLVSEDEWASVSRSIKALYEDKIRGTQYPVSTALLQYMWGEMTKLL